MKLTDSSEFGLTRRFSDAHIVYALHIMREGRIGRVALAGEMGIGEGSVRNVLKLLRFWGMIESTRDGTALTESGRRFLEDLRMDLVDVPQTAYVPGACQSAVLVHGVASTAPSRMHPSDSDVVACAHGTQVFRMEGGVLMMQGERNVDERELEFACVVRAAGMRDGDVLVVGGADNSSAATAAALAVGLDML